MQTLLIGLDDTDNATSRGTGHLARMLLGECVARGMRGLGVTRHQFLVDPRIAYTSHNSGACVAVACEGGAERAAFAHEFVAREAAQGSDPGVCVATRRAVGEEVVAFGWRATREVLTLDEALAAARRGGIDLRALGGGGDGVIGALASVGLRAEGNEGRFIDMPGLRDLGGRVAMSDLAALGIEVVRQGGGAGPGGGGGGPGGGVTGPGGWPTGPGDGGSGPGDRRDLETLGWVRPRVVGGRAVLPVEWSQERDAWVPVDRKKSRPLE